MAAANLRGDYRRTSVGMSLNMVPGGVTLINWRSAARRALTTLFRSFGFSRGFSEPSLRVSLRYWY